MEKLKGSSSAKLHKFAPILLFLISLSALLWFKSNQILYFHDEIIPLLPRQFLHDYLYVWRHASELGVSSSGGLPKLTAISLFTFLSTLGLGIGVIEKVFSIVILFLAGYTCYRLLLYLLSEETIKYHYGAALFGAVFYMLNPFALFYIWRLNYIITRGWFYCLAPLVLLAIIKLTEAKSKRDVAIYLFIFSLSDILIVNSFSQPAFYLMYLMLIPLGVLFGYLRSTQIASSSIIKLLSLIVVSLLLNCFWLLPTYSTSAAQLNAASVIGIQNSFDINSANLSLGSNLLLTQNSSLYENSKWYIWQSYYSSKFILFVTVIFFGFLVYLIARQKNKLVYFTLLIYVLLLPLSIGLSPPLTGIKTFLFNNSVIFQSFRDPSKWAFFLLILLVILIGNAFLTAYTYLNRYAVIVVGSILILLLSWPFFTNKVVPIKYKYPSAKIQIPSDYYAAANYLNKKDSGPILELPLHGTQNSAIWGPNNGYKGVDLLSELSDRSLLSVSSSDRLNALLKGTINAISHNSIDNTHLNILLNNLGVSYIVVNKDSNSNFVYTTTSPQNFIKILKGYTIFQSVFNSTNLAIFKLNNVQTSHNVLIPQNILGYKDFPVQTLDLLSSSKWSPANNRATLTETSEMLEASYTLNKNNYIYFKNNSQFNIEISKYSYLKISSNLNQLQNTKLAVSAEATDGSSQWLPIVAAPNIKNNNAEYFSLSGFQEPIKYLRLNIITQPKSSKQLTLRITGISAIDNLYNDYDLYKSADLNNSIYIDSSNKKVAYQNTNTKVNYTYINPTSYKINITHISDSADVVLREAYDSGWAVTNKSLALHEITSKVTNLASSHFIASGFYNGWLVDFKKACVEKKLKCTQNNDGTYNTVVWANFMPQNNFYRGFAVSVLTLSAILVYLMWPYFPGTHRGRRIKRYYYDRYR